MASVYILYAPGSDKFYIGSTKDLDQRILFHQVREFTRSFTAKYSDWELFYEIPNLSNKSARQIELHIKRMKSRKYFENLKTFPEIAQRLMQLYG